MSNCLESSSDVAWVTVTDQVWFGVPGRLMLKDEITIQHATPGRGFSILADSSNVPHCRAIQNNTTFLLESIIGDLLHSIVGGSLARGK